MAKTPTKRVSKPTAKALKTAKLKCFSHGEHDHPGFAYTRYWYEGDGERGGITPWIAKKLRPGSDPRFGKAAKSEVLLPWDAPGEYADLDYLTKRFDETLPAFQSHAMVQAKLALDPQMPWPAGYEEVRAFAKAQFATRFPTVLVAHVPGTAALEGNGNHVHCIVLARAINSDGLAGTCYRLCSDTGYESALAAWRSHFKTQVAA